MYEIISNKEETACLECGTAFYGRANRKFCSEACKNHYNNRRHQNARDVRLKVQTRLEKNYRILSDVLKVQKSSVDLVDLLVLGYSPNFVTSYQKTSRFTICMCYDISFTVSATRLYNIRKVEYSGKERK